MGGRLQHQPRKGLPALRLTSVIWQFRSGRFPGIPVKPGRLSVGFAQEAEFAKW